MSFNAEVGACRAQLSANRIEVIGETRIGPMDFLAVRDPDGRLVCFGSRWPGADTR